VEFVGFGDGGEVEALAEVLPEQAVGVLVEALSSRSCPGAK
jgi:hypothetical protein